MALIEVRNLSKEFRQHRRFPGALGAIRTLFTREYTTRQAVGDLSFDIQQGEAVGYVGPNGAGKSTTIKMLTGILVPGSGSIRVNGLVPHKARRENAKHIGVVFGQRSQLWWDLPVIDSFDLHKHIYHISQEQYHNNLSFFTQLLSMEDSLQVPVRQLSLGQRMRAEIALGYLVALLAFWFLTTLHFEWAMMGLITVFSGSFLPLWFFPPGWLEVARTLPFQFLGFVPAAIYMGKLSAGDIWPTMLVGIVWTLLLLGLTSWIWSASLKRLVVQGG